MPPLQFRGIRWAQELTRSTGVTCAAAGTVGRHGLGLWLTSLLLLLCPLPVDAARTTTIPPLTVGNGTRVATIVHLYGASLGTHWTGLRPRMATDYASTSNLEQLDISLPIYIDWEIDSYVVPGHCLPCNAPDPKRVDPPRPLANEPWFIGCAEYFVPQIADGIQTHDRDYTSCPAGRGLEEPVTLGLTATGEMRVKDIHGGTGGWVGLGWVRELCYNDRFCEYWIIALQWGRVQTYTNMDTQLRCDPAPGQTVTQPVPVTVPRPFCDDCQIDNFRSELFVTQWVSTDVGTVSPGVVDGYDLAALSGELGNPVRWGYDPPLGGGPASRNYQVNFAPFDDFIDVSDLAAFAGDFGKGCGLSNSGGATSPDTLMAWFGFARTGRSVAVGPGEAALPEWALVDVERNRWAIAHPEGYRDGISPVAPVSWGAVKLLYR